MDTFTDFIRTTKTWRMASRGRDLAVFASKAFQGIFHIDSGFFVYRRRFLAPGLPHAYVPWGAFAGLSDDLQHGAQWTWRILENASLLNQWLSPEAFPFRIQEFCVRSGVRYLSVWPITPDKTASGAVILAWHGSVNPPDASLMELCVGQFSLLFELVVARRVAEELGKHDPLTGLRNRRAMLDDFEGFTENDATVCETRPSENILIGIVDLNDFKLINDRYGHLQGDQVLEAMARLLMDKLGDDALLARWGGDEFAFVVRTPLSPKAFAEDVMTWSQVVSPTAVGCSVYGEEGNDWDTCMTLADARMYQNKVTLANNRATSVSPENSVFKK